VDYTLDMNTFWNASKNDYNIREKGFRTVEIIRFEFNSSRIEVGYTIQDNAAIKALALTNSNIEFEYLCAGIIFPACNGTFPGEPGPRQFLGNTGFTSIEQCVTFFHSLSQTNICPYPYRSNTAQCRVLHGFSSFFLPQVHCSHVKPVGNNVCNDTCATACSDCSPNAECVATYPNITSTPQSFTPVYMCKCKNGYVGNGTTCTAKTCEYGICPAKYGSYDCSSGNLCKCTETFVSQPVNFGQNLCVCPAGGQIIYKNSKPICVPAGRCLDAQWQCEGQRYSQVRCTGNNTFSLFKDCVCNHGFSGGYEYPCVCATGNRVVWSDAHQGEVCLPPTGCTVNWHCSSPQTCVIPNGQLVGQCIAMK
jgi:hypothetical protein